MFGVLGIQIPVIENNYVPLAAAVEPLFKAV